MFARIAEHICGEENASIRKENTYGVQTKVFFFFPILSSFSLYDQSFWIFFGYLFGNNPIFFSSPSTDVRRYVGVLCSIHGMVGLIREIIEGGSILSR